MLQGSKATIEQARRLRKAMTLPEVLLWRGLRLRPGGLKFRRQHPATRYVTDFYCHEARLIVEVDGESHERGSRPRRDTERDAWFAARGIRVLRIPARTVLADVNAVAEGIVAEAMKSSPVRGGGRRQPDGGVSASRDKSTSSYDERATPLHHPAAPGGPPPLTGEDFSRASLE